ncbi:MAG: DUF6941 family protein [Candidatus Rokuibacteriota bacterium]
MKLRLFLADSAEVREQLLFILGGGWTEVGPAPQPFALAGIIEVTWEETNRRRRLELLIEDEDGRPLNVATPTGEQPFKIEAGFDVGRPPGAPGRSFNLPIAVTVAPVPWTPGRRYIVKAVVDGETMDQVAFEVRPQPQLPPQPR